MKLPERNDLILIGVPSIDRNSISALVQQAKVMDSGEIIAQVDYLQNGHNPVREWVIWSGDHWRFRVSTPCGTSPSVTEAILRDLLAQARKWSP